MKPQWLNAQNWDLEFVTLFVIGAWKLGFNLGRLFFESLFPEASVLKLDFLI